MIRNRVLATALSLALGASGLFGTASQAFGDTQVIYRNGSHASVAVPETKALPGISVVADGSSLTIGRARPGATKPVNVA